jgi:RNA polymerase sigma factor (sigma-70 family)
MREDDATLLRRYAEECAQDAFTELVRRNMDAVYSAALRRVGGDTHLAQDVAQEVFVILARRTSELANHPVLSGWLYTTTRNVAANLVRRESRRKFREQRDQVMHEPYFSEQNEADWLQVSPVLDEAIDELTENDRLAVLLRYFDRQTFAEIGSVLHLSEDAARMRLARALERLRAALARRSITSSAATVGLLLTRHTVSAAPAGLAISAAGEALALAPGVSVAAAQSIFTFSVPVILSLAAFVGAMLTFTWVSRTAWLEKDALAAADAKLADTSRRLREAEQHTSAQDRTREHLRIAVRQSEDRILSASPTRATVAPVYHSAVGFNKPVTAQLAGGRRAALTATYHSLYRTWGFTPAQIQDFERIAVNASSDAIWVFDTSSANAVSAQTAVTPSRADSERQIQALLGSERYAQYQEFNRNTAAQTVAVRLASATYLTDAVTSTKAQELISLLGRSSAVYLAGGSMNTSALDWDHLLDEAKARFSPTQLAALEELHRQDTLQQAMAARIAQLIVLDSTASR